MLILLVDSKGLATKKVTSFAAIPPAALCALYEELAGASLIGTLVVPDFCTPQPKPQVQAIAAIWQAASA